MSEPTQPQRDVLSKLASGDWRLTATRTDIYFDKIRNNQLIESRRVRLPTVRELLRNGWIGEKDSSYPITDAGRAAIAGGE